MDPQFETPTFWQSYAPNRQTLQSLHFCNNEILPENANRPFKIEPIIKYFSNYFTTNNQPKQNICLDE